jgi:hypothetical protein
MAWEWGARGRGARARRALKSPTRSPRRIGPAAGSMLQGMQNQRVWGAVINEQTGRMWATVGEDDEAIVPSGACLTP